MDAFSVFGTCLCFSSFARILALRFAYASFSAAILSAVLSSCSPVGFRTPRADPRIYKGTVGNLGRRLLPLVVEFGSEFPRTTPGG